MQAEFGGLLHVGTIVIDAVCGRTIVFLHRIHFVDVEMIV
jgi:hypothetical protein